MTNNELINKYALDILSSSNMNLEKKHMHHGNITTYEHSMNVTNKAIDFVRKFNIKVDIRTLIRGCLLHDYYLYDWHNKEGNKGMHGFRHAMIALKNASKEYELNNIEKNMIYTHMFPLNLRIPKYKESLVLCLVDKVCACKELKTQILINFGKKTID